MKRCQGLIGKISYKSFGKGYDHMGGIERFKCDTCKEPATHAARDYHTVVNFITQTQERVPADCVKFGCDSHPVDSVELEVRQ